MKTPITIAIMAKNEEKRIRPCLESVKWADEVLVLDDESTDATAQIAESYGARVIKRKLDIEGRHRNFLYSHAKNEWVLSLDADEHVTPELAKEITDTLQSAKDQFAGYAIPMKNFIGTRWIKTAGYYPSARLKMYKRDKFKYEESGVHPRAFLDGPCGRLNEHILHYSFRDFSHFITKFNRETDLEAEKWIQDKRKMSFGLALFKATDRFFRAFLTKKGYKDGFLGFILSCFSSWYQLVTYAKYWEMKQKNRLAASA